MFRIWGRSTFSEKWMSQNINVHKICGIVALQISPLHFGFMIIVEQNVKKNKSDIRDSKPQSLLYHQESARVASFGNNHSGDSWDVFAGWSRPAFCRILVFNTLTIANTCWLSYITVKSYSGGAYCCIISWIGSFKISQNGPQEIWIQKSSYHKTRGRE